ncbi:hypothetical protein LCGC14_2769410 [marine sediment metagenome]|uniref:Uncharacterized protein n=1 Tax=marine sediment metagenome TaxID=412755 RepID=A0A0F8YWM2_9ZZZZ
MSDWIIKNEIIELTETGVLVICIAMFWLKLLGLNISWWFILLPMIVVIICVVTAAYLSEVYD